MGGRLEKWQSTSRANLFGYVGDPNCSTYLYNIWSDLVAKQETVAICYSPHLPIETKIHVNMLQ